MKRRGTQLALLLAIFAAPTIAPAQQTDEEELIVKIYRVVDLVLPVPNYPYLGTYLPQLSDAAVLPQLSNGGAGAGKTPSSGGLGGGMFQVPDRVARDAAGGGGIGGGGIGMMGGGMSESSATRRTPAMGFDIDDLIDAITSIVAPSSWDEVGGPGTLQPIGGALAVLQTAAVHDKLEEFLEALKRESGTLRMMTIKARWVSLDRQQRDGLATEPGAAAANDSVQLVNPQALAALPASTRHYSGQITCFNGQTVHLISGRSESIVSSVIPVAGGSNASYQPVIHSPHLGVFLQITPSALPDKDDVLVDLHSSITRWEQPSKPVAIGTTPAGEVSVAIDRMNLTAQQFATSFRLPQGQPVLVGGITSAGDGSRAAEGEAGRDADAPHVGLYLVLEVHSASE